MKATIQELLTPAESDRSLRWTAIAVLILAELMLYGAGLVHGLAADDFVFRDVYSRPVSSLWSQPSDVHGHWRPLSYSAKHVLYSFLGENPFPWHAINILIHLASVLLFFRILLRLSESFEKQGLVVAVVVCIVFQTHPASVQNVYWASGFSDLLCMLFLLLATFFSVGSLQRPKTAYALAAGVFFAAALLSKESAIVYPVFLAVMLRFALGSWRRVFGLHGRLLGALGLFSIAFGILFFVLCGRILLQQPEFLHGASGVYLRALAMLVIPTDAMSIYVFGHASLVADIAIIATVVAAIALFVRRHVFDGSTILLIGLVLVGFAVYAVGGYISLRLMYGSVGFFAIVMYVVLHRKPWWAERDLQALFLRGVVFLYAVVTVYFSLVAVLDWHVADKFSRALGASFINYHQTVQERQYVFGALPSRIRQAEILGEPGTDFRGQLRQNEISDSVDMSALLRIVLLDREDVSANVVLLRNSDTSLIISTQTDNQFFLLGKVNTPMELPAGTSYVEGDYTVEILETILNDRATTVRVTAKNPVDLDRILFFDDQVRQFVPLRQIEPGSQDELNG